MSNISCHPTDPILAASYFSHSVCQINSISQVNNLLMVPPDGRDGMQADHQFVIVATVCTMGCSLGSSCVTLWLYQSVRLSHLYLDWRLYPQALCPILVNCLLSSSKFKVSHLLSIPYVIALDQALLAFSLDYYCNWPLRFYASSLTSLSPLCYHVFGVPMLKFKFACHSSA